MKQFRTTALVGMAMAFGGIAQAEEVLRGVSALPPNNVITQSFLEYVDMVNEAGAGVVRIEVIGGPEAIPPGQQDTALRNGVIDIQGGPAGYYAGTVPESEALTGATVTAAEARANGAFDMLKAAWRDRLGAELLAWNGNGTQYYLYLSEVPELDAEGNVVLSGKKLRSAGTYRDWFDAIGAENVMMEQSEVFSALERGVVDGFGWIAFVSDVGVNSLLKARVGPAVWQGSPVIMMNGARYDALPDEAKAVLQDAALALEEKIAAEMPARMASEEERLTADGIELIEPAPDAAARYSDVAYSVVWDKLAKTAPEFEAAIKPLLYPAP
ncbi:type 2 periplasmic-binding domain-containing protein [Frigidibacter oleivorans]|uniref:C4-dicarboxylate ABC transporter substrate-binding protein n=1 Tax=Frigidibacter oleivorans TaxID=2487129 RepID=UPI0013DF1BFE|nr:C4-dicarboxylate ABC transporter substrate-binding protein [Frigidibacter oleivorans]